MRVVERVVKGDVSLVTCEQARDATRRTMRTARASTSSSVGGGS